MLSAVPKISHNLPMEAVWTKKVFGVWVKNWQDDTLLAQHCLHNQKPVNLKFCVYSNFGIVGYDKSVEKYIRPTEAESDKHGENGFNTLKNAPIEEVLLYNALDSLFTYKLRDILRDKMDKFVTDGYEFLVKSATTLSKMSYNGIRVNENAFTEAEVLLKEQLEKVRAEFYAQPEIKKWDGDEPISMTSTQQVSHLTYDILKVKPLKYTDKGTPSF
jgi:DNA polymerase I-like protein with 3'-5' exonuclease and polymerase domains